MEFSGFFMCVYVKKIIDIELTLKYIIESVGKRKGEGNFIMTIKEVCEKYNISADTLRYYERVGVIPSVARTKGGIRDYTEQDLGWVENAICMRNAGLSVETLAEYVRLFQEGDDTIQARRELLMEAKEEIAVQLKKYQETIERLYYKISRYDEAIKTGILTWDATEQ